MKHDSQIKAAERGSCLFRDEHPNRLSNHKLSIVKDIYIQKTLNGYNRLYLKIQLKTTLNDFIVTSSRN